MGQIDTLEVEFDNNLAVYREGDRISGKVKLETKEDVKVKDIRIELYGIAVVHWNDIEGGEIEFDPDQKLKGNVSKEQYFHQKFSLLGKDAARTTPDKYPTIYVGHYTYTFDFKLPPELPSSFEGLYGQIRYLAKAYVDRPKKNPVVAKKGFTVLSGLDLNFIPEAAPKIEICKYKQLGTCCSSGSVVVDWNIDRSGFVPGEDILIHGAIQNESKMIVAFSKAALYLVVEYQAKKKKKLEKREIAVIDKGETLPGDVTVWMDSLHIPPVPPTGLNRCHLIDISYEVQFTALIEGGYSPVSFTKEIYIGTVPMSHREMRSCIAGMFNQPYSESIDELNKAQGFTSSSGKAQSTISLTQIIAAACVAEPMLAPTAPTLATIEREGYVSMLPEPIEYNPDRPPPYAPGHIDEPSEPLQPNAPSINTLAKDWPNMYPSLDFPSFESNAEFGTVHIEEENDDTESIRGDTTFAPVYPYYTLPRGAASINDKNNETPEEEKKDEN